ncbi:MAG: cupin domain-containing protein [Pseudomonadota bacterium]
MLYRPGDDVGPLEDWPFTPGPSAYSVISGDPRASGRLDAGGPGHVTRAGIWRCSLGVFECTEQGDELMTLLSGRCVITDHRTGEATHLTAGDTYLIKDGTRVTWDIQEEVTKVFFAFNPRGY